MLCYVSQHKYGNSIYEIIMYSKLEQRIKRLEKRLFVKNQQLNDSAEAVYRTANQINDLCKQLAAIIKSSGESQFEIDNALSMCEDDFPKMWFDRLNRINNGNL